MVGDNPESQKPTAKQLSCPGCNSTIEVRGLGQTCTIACISCGTIFDINDSKFELIRALDKLPFKPLIPLGTRGKFEEGVFEMIGAMRRTDKSGVYFWDEYLLFNPYKGFRWLVENQGHWSYVTTIKGNPDSDTYSVSSYGGETFAIDYEGEQYKLFLKGIAKVKYVLGEFYWQVRLNDQSDVADYIAPPHMLSMEGSHGERVWSHGKYLKQDEVASIFPQIQSFPSQNGIAPNQPSAIKEYLKPVMILYLLTVGLMIFIQILNGAKALNQKVLYGENSYLPLDTQKSATSQRFFTRKKANLSILTNSAVNNNWLDLEIALIDTKTGQDYEGGIEMAYYQGVDSDGHWSEGSTYGRVLFSEIPAGEYYLTFTPQSGTPTLPERYTYEVISDVPYWGNFILALLIISVFPLLSWILNIINENKRWEDSDPHGEYS